MTTTISNSEIRTADRCRRKWALQYHRRLLSNKLNATGPLPFGTALHAALEVTVEDKDPVAQFARNRAYERLHVMEARVDDTSIDIAKFDSETELGRIMLEGFVEWIAETGIDRKYKTIATEQEVSYDIPELDVRLTGLLDALEMDVETQEIFFKDWKSCASLDGPVKILATNTQTLTYQLLLKLTNPNTRIEGGILRMMRKVKRTATAKPPFYAEARAYHSERQLRTHWLHTTSKISEIMRMRRRLDAGEDHQVVAPPNPTNDCSWDCPFYLPCQTALFDDGSAIEDLLAANYHVGDPYARYSDRKTA